MLFCNSEICRTTLSSDSYGLFTLYIPMEQRVSYDFVNAVLMSIKCVSRDTYPLCDNFVTLTEQKK